MFFFNFNFWLEIIFSLEFRFLLCGKLFLNSAQDGERETIKFNTKPEKLNDIRSSKFYRQSPDSATADPIYGAVLYWSPPEGTLASSSQKFSQNSLFFGVLWFLEQFFYQNFYDFLYSKQFQNVVVAEHSIAIANIFSTIGKFSNIIFEKIAKHFMESENYYALKWYEAPRLKK